MKNIFNKTALLILPIVFLYFGYNYHRCTYGFDPEYAYLMNGLMINNCYPVGHVDNPGTTVQWFSALVQRSVHIFRKSDDINKDVILNPDHYIESGRKGLIILNSIMILLLGFLVFRFTGNVLYSFIIQITPFLSSNLLEQAWARFSLEPMLFFAASVFIIVLLLYYFRPDFFKSRFAILFGISVGFGLATKATFLPLILIPLFLLSGKREILKYGLSILASFVVFTIPAIPSYHIMFSWFLRLFTHTGVYGQGEAGVIDFNTYFSAILQIFRNNSGLTFSIMAAMILIASRILKDNTNIFKNQVMRIIISLLAAQLFGIFMVAKHYHANHYLIPVNTLTGLMFIFILLHILQNTKLKLANIIYPSVLLILFIALSASNIPDMINADKGYVESNVETEKFEKRLNIDYKGYKLVTCHDRMNKYSSLKWGCAYSRSKFVPLISDFYPDAAFLDQNSLVFSSWTDEFFLEDFSKKFGKKILLYDGPFSGEEFAKQRSKGLYLNKKYIGRIHNIYEIDTIDSRQILEIEHDVVWQRTFDPDSVSGDEKYFISGTEKIINNWHRTVETSYSGKNSALLQKENNFAFDYTIPSVQEGQFYQVTVWKKSQHEKTVIVAGSIDSNDFWEGSNEVVGTSNDGWKKLRLRFHVPGGIKKGIKLYVWNNSAEKVYLDDFTITRLK